MTQAVLKNVFVYGTLKHGFGNHGILGDSKKVSDAVTTDKFDMLNAGFPVLLPNKDGHRVVGEVYECSPETLRRLDRLEGEGSMYLRQRWPVVMVDDVDFVDVYIGAPKYWDKRQMKKIEPTPDGVLVFTGHS